MKQPQSTYGNDCHSTFLLFRERLAALSTEELRELSGYARRHLEIIRCWHLNPLQLILDAWQISKAWFYRLIHKFVKAGLAGLEDRRGRPKGSGKQITPQERALLCKIRQGCPWLGSRRLEAILGSIGRFHHSTIHRCLQEEGLVHTHPYRRRRPFQLVRQSEPNARWCLDFTEFYSPVLQRTVYRLEIVDDCTNARLSTKLCLVASAEAAAEAVRAAIAQFGAPNELRSDNGRQFRGARSGGQPTRAFAALAAEFGCTFSYASPGCPHEHGKAEHACRDFKVEVLSDEVLFWLVSADPVGLGEQLLLLFNRFQNWLPNQGHHLFGASPQELHPQLAISKQAALEAFETLYLKPKGMSFKKEEWQLLLQKNN